MTSCLHSQKRRIELRARGRLKPSPEHQACLLTVEEGVVALETSPAGGRRQILEFLLAGDVLPAATIGIHAAYFLRAISDASLVVSVSSDHGGTESVDALIKQFKAHADRCNLHRIIIGQLDTQARVATFLLAQALRANGALKSNMRLELPMSRDDIADHLSINPDTLSRIMMRFENAAIIRRINRHAITLITPDELGEHTPLSPQFLTLALGKGATGNREAVLVGVPPVAPFAPQAPAA
jgi:CRP-like cAMP-binding protein